MYFVEHQGADLLNEAVVLRVMDQSAVGADTLQSLLEASKHRQIVIARTENGEPLASLAFARISKYTLRLLAANAEHKLRPYEYREGKILFVLDGFFRKNSFRKALAVLAPQLGRDRLIAFVRNGRLRVFYNHKGSMRPVHARSIIPAN
jgi:hypothetical protein